MLRIRRHDRIRRRLAGTGQRPRLVVSRSLKNVSAQVVDDTAGRTLVAASSVEPELAKTLSSGGGGNVAGAREVGRVLGQRAKAAGISEVVFDRGGFAYHGRIAALADAVREQGLEL
ncbi:MAG: 50S ribosomal protein L18 [Acidimicrobiales bacterium]